MHLIKKVFHSCSWLTYLFFQNINLLNNKNYGNFIDKKLIIGICRLIYIYIYNLAQQEVQLIEMYFLFFIPIPPFLYILCQIELVFPLMIHNHSYIMKKHKYFLHKYEFLNIPCLGMQIYDNQSNLQNLIY